MNNDDFVVLSLEEHTKIMERLKKLDALEAGGVDNWDGYDFAMEEIWEEND